ncbi:hypothetical protein D3Z45_05625 [Lachnospiraceae bacterium]|nr:hypothetical protein [Lachnospiraceae bacterium]
MTKFTILPFRPTCGFIGRDDGILFISAGNRPDIMLLGYMANAVGYFILKIQYYNFAIVSRNSNRDTEINFYRQRSGQDLWPMQCCP